LLWPWLFLGGGCGAAGERGGVGREAGGKDLGAREREETVMKRASRIGSVGHAVRRWGAAAGVALGLVACGPQDLNGAHALGGGTDASVTARRVDLAPPAAPATAAETDQKASIHAAYLSARMKEAASDVRYAITPSKLAPLVARSWSKGFEGRFDERGVALSPSDGADWQGRMDVVRFGCREKLEAVTGGAPVRDGKDANRLSYVRHAGKETFTETWVNGEPGMEQGFTVERSPCPALSRCLPAGFCQQPCG
jgi:hypothetical protein